MRAKSRLLDMSERVSTIRRACHRDALFLYELKGYRYVLFGWCHDPSRTPQTLFARQGPDIRTNVEPDIWPTNSDTNPSQPVRFPGIPRCPNVPETPETRKSDRTFHPWKKAHPVLRVDLNPLKKKFTQLWQPLLQLVPLNTLETRMQTAVCHVDMALWPCFPYASKREYGQNP